MEITEKGKYGWVDPNGDLYKMGSTYICVFQLLTYKKRSIVREFTKVYRSEARLPSKRGNTM